MKKLLLLFVALSVSAFAVPIGSCTMTTASVLIGDPCSLGDEMFSFTYTGNVDPSNINVDFQMDSDGTELRLIVAPITGAGFFTNFMFTTTIAVVPNIVPNVLPAVYQIIGVRDQSDFSFSPNSSGLLDIANSPGPTYDFTPDNDAGSPVFINPTSTITTTVTLNGGGGVGDANPGLSSFELGYIQAATVVPEPASLGLIGLTLVCLGLLQKQAA